MGAWATSSGPAGRVRAQALAAGALFALMPAALPQAETLVSLERTRAPVVGRGGVTQMYALLAPAGAHAVVVLLPGGSGRLDLAADGPARGVNNFLVRSRELFARHGLVVALVDAASDFRQLSEGLHGRRLDDEHLSDIAAVFADLRARYPELPMWLLGTSRGAVAAAAAGLALGPAPAGPRGLVLASPVSRGSTRDGDALEQVALEELGLPVLLIAHAHDRCVVSPPADLQNLARRLPRAAMRVFDGGTDEATRACDARGPHGFLGIEPAVVEFISDWIRSH